MVVGTDDLVAGNNQLAVLPNPVSALLEVRLPELQQEALALKVYDATAQSVQEYRVRRGDSHIQLDMEELPAGLYFIQLMDGGVQYGAKVVKK